jgi:hypothetical protein
MNAKTIVMTVMLCFAGIGASQAADNANMGTWKLNVAKSTLPAAAPKNHTVVYAAAGDQIKVTVDGTDKDGKPAHNEWTGKFDGKDYPVTGDPTSDTRAYKTIDDHTLELTSKKGGATASTGSIVVSKDGKSRTVSLSGTDAAGKKFSSKAVYDKQ